VHPLLSVAVIEKVIVSAVSGIPVMKTSVFKFAPLRVNPLGRDPEEKTNVYPGAPPLATTLTLKQYPTTAVSKALGEIVISGHPRKQDIRELIFFFSFHSVQHTTACNIQIISLSCRT
jgi:hypothetical protein